MSDTALSEEMLAAIDRAVEARLQALMPRVGIGYDIHRFSDGRALVLGGVDVPSDQGLLGHSDADAATHAIIDALLGAACLGDIGHLFPDSDAQWKGADSLVLLRAVKARLTEAGFRVGSVDVTIIAEHPKMAPHVPAMRKNLEAILDAPVSVKATTHEKLVLWAAAKVWPPSPARC
jgi:2-C-methyl-D-erythritol 2,4-cyclodiphosphate synthase